MAFDPTLLGAAFLANSRLPRGAGMGYGMGNAFGQYSQAKLAQTEAEARKQERFLREQAYKLQLEESKRKAETAKKSQALRAKLDSGELSLEEYMRAADPAAIYTSEQGMKKAEALQKATQGWDINKIMMQHELSQRADQEKAKQAAMTEMYGPQAVLGGQPNSQPQQLPELPYSKRMDVEVTRQKEAAKAEEKKKQNMGKAFGAANEVKADTEVAMQAIDKAVAMLENGWNPTMAGLGAETMAEFGGTDATDLSALLKTVSNNVAFGKLSEMRQNSPTGGAVGQLTDKEREALGMLMGNLDIKQKDETLLQSLKQVKERLQGRSLRIDEALQRDFGKYMQNDEFDALWGD